MSRWSSSSRCSGLLDTNVVLAWSLDRVSLRPEVDELLMSSDTVRVLSAVTPWEIVIKWQLGKLPIPQPPRPFVERLSRELATDALPVTVTHAVRVADLPLHHGDPFDRLLIAQAQVEGIRSSPPTPCSPGTRSR